MTADAQRRRAVWQILLLSAGFLVLVAVSVSSVLLVNKARDASSLVVHTVEVEGQLSNLLLEIRRAESATRAYLLTSAPQFLAEYETAAANILPAADQLAKMRLLWSVMRMWMEWDYAWERWDEFHKGASGQPPLQSE